MIPLPCITADCSDVADSNTLFQGAQPPGDNLPSIERTGGGLHLAACPHFVLLALNSKLVNILGGNKCRVLPVSMIVIT